MPSALTKLYKKSTAAIRFRLKCRTLSTQVEKAGNSAWWLAPYNPEMGCIVDDICGNHGQIPLNTFALTRGSNDAGWTERFLKKINRPGMHGLSVGYRDITLLGIDFSSIFQSVRYCETGFIANRFEGSTKPFISYVMDSQAPYFDGRRSTDLEDQLNAMDAGWWTNDIEAVDFLAEFRSSNVQKYIQMSKASGTITTPTDLLIIGQCTGDQSLTFTAGTVKTNVDLVRNALRDHAKDFKRVFYRPHPKNPTIETDHRQIENEFGSAVTIIGVDEPFAHLLKGRPTVATMSSGGGLEAAVKGCPVISYCVSFYSNWGFTTDKFPCPRRTAKFSVEDVFLYVYMRYSRYLNPFGPGHISPLEALRATALLPQQKTHQPAQALNQAQRSPSASLDHRERMS